MIAVRIPEEIRKYKEKIAFGLTARQLVSTVLAVAICVPLYWFGRRYISDDVLSWLLILIALPLLAVGWVSFQGGHITFGSAGMPTEKFFFVWLKFEALYPRKRKFHTNNAFREWQNEGYAEELPKSGRERRRMMKEKKEANLEKAFLLAEAEVDGRATYSTDPNAETAATYNVDEQELLTVRKRSNPTGDGKKDDNNKKKKEKVKKKSNLQIKAEAIEQKRKENPEYVPTKAEFKILSKWYIQQEKNRKKEINQGKKEITKKSKQMQKRRTAKTAIPRSTQDSIPYVADYEEDIVGGPCGPDVSVLCGKVPTCRMDL